MLCMKESSHRFIEYSKGGGAVKQQGKILERVVLGADLPGESLPGIPLVEIAGEGRVLIENHHGVIAYGCKEICVKVHYGHICICGMGLALARMTKHQLVVTGRIDSVSLCRGRK